MNFNLNAKNTLSPMAKLIGRLTALLAVVALIATVMLSSGCFAVAAGAGAGAAVAYVRGDLDATLKADYDHSVRAVEKAVEQLKLAKVSEEKNALKAVIITRNAADVKIELHIERLADDATKLKIRVGTFGNDELQLEVLDRVKKNL